jgi:predicted  nucleic acid-binding Zn-ribbon protein
MTRLSILFRLQTLDSQIDAHRARVAEIGDRLKHHPELDQARADEDSARGKLETARQALGQSEEATRRQQQHISATDQKLYGGKVGNPKELQDLQEEAAALRRHLSVLEERQLQAMMQCEDMEKSVAAAQSRRAELEAERKETEGRLLEEQGAEQSALATLDVQREAAVSSMAPEDLEKYTRLRQAKRGLAVVRLEGGSCAGCGVAPPSARIDAARSGQEIVQCSNCGRILYLG